MHITSFLTILSLTGIVFFTACNDQSSSQSASITSLPTVPASVVTISSTAPVAVPAASSAMPAEARQTVQEPASAQAPQLVRKPETTPAVLYQKCAACHGNHAEKSALNQSEIIGGWDSKRITAAIVGYQEGTYGGAMKTLMHNQVKDLSRIQIEALSDYIANLYVRTH